MGNGHFTRKLSVQRSSRGDGLRIHLVCMDLVGLDIQELYTPHYSQPPISRPLPRTAGSTHTGGCGIETLANKSRGPVRSVGGESGGRKACSHRCINKAVYPTVTNVYSKIVVNKLQLAYSYVCL